MSDLVIAQDKVYATPKAEVETVNQVTASELAERKDRFFAAFVDSILALAVAIPFMFIAGPYLGFENLESQPGY